MVQEAGVPEESGDAERRLREAWSALLEAADGMFGDHVLRRIFQSKLDRIAEALDWTELDALMAELRSAPTGRAGAGAAVRPPHCRRAAQQCALAFLDARGSHGAVKQTAVSARPSAASALSALCQLVLLDARYAPHRMRSACYQLWRVFARPPFEPLCAPLPLP